jgi:hypothetical protein
MKNMKGTAVLLGKLFCTQGMPVSCASDLYWMILRDRLHGGN